MSKQLVTAYSHSNVTKAVRLMVEHNIGSVVVQDDEGPIGVFTERDLLSKVLARGKRLEEPILMEVMTRSFNVVRQDATLVDASKIMTEKKGRLMVFDDGDLIGIVTATDLLGEINRFGKSFDFTKAYSGRIYAEGPDATLELIIQLMDKRRIGSVIVSEGKLPRGIFTERDLLRRVLDPEFRTSSVVGEFATRPVVTAEKGIDGREAAQIMISRHVKRLPLTEADKIVGIVTARDLVDGFASSAW